MVNSKTIKFGEERLAQLATKERVQTESCWKRTLNYLHSVQSQSFPINKLANWQSAMLAYQNCPTKVEINIKQIHKVRLDYSQRTWNLTQLPIQAIIQWRRSMWKPRLHRTCEKLSMQEILPPFKQEACSLNSTYSYSRSATKKLLLRKRSKHQTCFLNWRAHSRQPVWRKSLLKVDYQEATRARAAMLCSNQPVTCKWWRLGNSHQHSRWTWERTREEYAHPSLIQAVDRVQCQPCKPS